MKDFQLLLEIVRYVEEKALWGICHRVPLKAKLCGKCGTRIAQKRSSGLVSCRTVFASKRKSYPMIPPIIFCEEGKELHN